MLAMWMLLALLAVQDQEEPQRGIGGVSSEQSSTGYARRHALVVGIDAYQDPAYPDLGYAVADARAVAKTLVDSYGFEEDDVRLILNEDATKVALDKALEEWACDPARVGDEDILVVFFAGHGVTRELGSRGSRGYLVPVDGRADTQGEYSWSTLVGMNHLEDVSEAIPAKHVLFILDCCFGGLAVKRSAPPIAAGLSNRARQVITAGNAQQAVLDTGGEGHSVFTGALLDALAGSADLDGDNVITFGELFNHVGREVERKTEERQTPLQATFPDHEGGNIALFAPGVEPGQMTAAERLKALERTAEERLAEMERLSDALLVQQLMHEADELWPQEPAMVSRYRDWLDKAKNLLERRGQHEESVRHVRQEAFLSQVVAGQLEEGEGTEPMWDEVAPKLRWRFETFTALAEGLDELEEVLAAVERRLEVASTIYQLSIEDHAAAWEEAIASIATLSLYDGLRIKPELGLVPIGQDPASGLWEFWHMATGEEPARGEDRKLVLTEEMGVVLVLVPGGSFWMGASADPDAEHNHDAQALSDEAPVHEVSLAPCFLSKYELTQAQWQRLAGWNRSSYGPAGQWMPAWTSAGVTATGLSPLTDVSWLDCMEWLPRVGLSLPTEAQWENACRAGSETVWWPGSEPMSLVGVANLLDRHASDHGVSGEYEEWLDDGAAAHAPVGTYRANPYGLHDVHGNVGEWCLDWWSAGSYARLAEDSGEASKSGAFTRVSRGGSFTAGAALARSSFRDDDPPWFTDVNLGVRPARVITK